MDASYAPPTVHKSDLFFSGPPAPPPIPPNHPLSHHTSYSAAKPRTPPNPHRSRTAPPPTAPPTYLPPPPPPPHLNGSDVLSPTDQDELQAVLQLSKSESEKQTLFMEKLSSQEEEELARALEESMRGSESSTPGAGPSRPTVPIIHNLLFRVHPAVKVNLSPSL
ncbi:hypothetical protein BT96DRAFT_471336 [Gymnopus androsaceus JB14]|uniref:Uncharacterized protein n=1 Tax=Gymnopus androsaceus JB14 TaxID=1447944 RepID=A0A6A4IPM3_9AGAR|nr:hypothetical protein BT96DRAFT_471336 [Gymnopus androsaceus JB14]